MGFEIVFHFFEKAEGEEDFDREDIKTRAITIGEALDEVPVEKVAATILKEYQKQNVWIDNVEIHQWVKKPLKFSETKSGGVKIGNKAYNLGLNEIMKWAVDDSKPQIVLPGQIQAHHIQPTPQPPPQQTPPPQQVVPLYQAPAPQAMPIQEQQLPPIQRTFTHQDGTQTYAQSPQEAYPEQPQQQPTVAPPSQRQQLRTSQAGLVYSSRIEVCDPPPELRADLQGLNLTMGQRYEISREQTHPNGRDYMYQIKNDAGKEVLVGWQYFRQQQGVVQTTSYVDANNTLRDVTQLVDHVAAESREQRPRLLYEGGGSSHWGSQAVSGPQTSYSEVGDPQIGNMLQKMDAALARRRPMR